MVRACRGSRPRTPSVNHTKALATTLDRGTTRCEELMEHISRGAVSSSRSRSQSKGLGELKCLTLGGQFV